MKEYVVNLLGKGDGWQEIRNVKDGEIWGVNDSFLRIKCDKSFHMHDLNEFLKDPKTASSTRLVIRNIEDGLHKDMKFYTTHKFKEIPSAILYPLDEIVDRFNSNYFVSTIDYMIAYALYLGATKIRLFGINMSVMNEEFYSQKPSAEFWLGLAMGMGVEIDTEFTKSSLFKIKDGHLYGYLIKQWKL